MFNPNTGVKMFERCLVYFGTLGSRIHKCKLAQIVLEGLKDLLLKCLGSTGVLHRFIRQKCEDPHSWTYGMAYQLTLCRPTWDDQCRSCVLSGRPQLRLLSDPTSWHPREILYIVSVRLAASLMNMAEVTPCLITRRHISASPNSRSQVLVHCRSPPLQVPGACDEAEVKRLGGILLLNRKWQMVDQATCQVLL